MDEKTEEQVNSIVKSIYENLRGPAKYYSISIHYYERVDDIYEEEVSLLEDNEGGSARENISASLRNIQKILQGEATMVERFPYVGVYIKVKPMWDTIAMYENLEVTEVVGDINTLYAKPKLLRLASFGISIKTKTKIEAEFFIQELLTILQNGQKFGKLDFEGSNYS